MFDYATTAHNNKKQQQIKLQQKIRSTLNDCSSASCCRRFCQRNELNLSYGLYSKCVSLYKDDAYVTRYSSVFKNRC